SQFVLGTGASASLGSQGLAGQQLALTNGNFKSVISGTLTANRTQTMPDVTGYIPVTSYVNSAYDNATRANGSIGGNWTIQQNGLNIASNQIQGTGAGLSNTGFWNANAFSTVQFAQATVTALNGTTDFPGVTELASGSPGLLISGNVATEKNWSGGNLHPLAQLDTEQDWTRTQHFTQGVAFGTETFTTSPRAEQNIFLPGALTSTWTGATWTN